jgi:hypothetical protein
MIESAPKRERNWNRAFQGFMLGLLLGVFALPIVWFLWRDPDRMTGLVAGVSLSIVVVLIFLAAS